VGAGNPGSAWPVARAGAGRPVTRGSGCEPRAFGAAPRGGTDRSRRQRLAPGGNPRSKIPDDQAGAATRGQTFSRNRNFRCLHHNRYALAGEIGRHRRSCAPHLPGLNQGPVRHPLREATSGTHLHFGVVARPCRNETSLRRRRLAHAGRCPCRSTPRRPTRR